MIKLGDIISYLEMCQNEGVNLQRVMNYRLKGGKMKKALFFVLIFCTYSIADASCIRCGLDKLVCEGDSKFSAISQCGNPDHSEIVGEDTEGHMSTESQVNLQERTVEKMYYNCGDGMFIKILTIKNGKIIFIDDGDRGSGPVKCN